jgi:hypothetical protein
MDGYYRDGDLSLRLIKAVWRRLERDDFSSIRHLALSFCLSVIFFEKPVPTFPDHAPVLAFRRTVLMV